MGNLIPAEIIVDSGTAYQRPELGILEWRALTTGTLRQIHIWLDSVSAGRYYFGLRINGVQRYLFEDRFAFTVAQLYQAKTGEAIPTVLGDLYQLDILQMTGAGRRVDSPITVLTVTEEG